MVIIKLLFPFSPILIVVLLSELLLFKTPVKRVYRLANFILLLGEFISCLIMGNRGWDISSKGPLQNWVLIILIHIALMLIVSFIIRMYYIVTFKKAERYDLRATSLANKERFRYHIIGGSLIVILLMVVNALFVIPKLQKELLGSWEMSQYDKCEGACLSTMTFNEDNTYLGVNETGVFNGEFTITMDDSLDYVQFTNFPYGNDLFEMHLRDNYNLFGGGGYYRTISFGNAEFSFRLYERD